MARAARITLVVPLVAMTVACGGSGGEAAEVEEAADARSGRAGLYGDTLTVDLDDFVIVIPDTLPAGALHLVARNRGVEFHNFELEHDGQLLWKFDSDIPPFQTDEAVLTLEPGEYQVICSVASHDSKGMISQITVVEAEDH